MWSSKDAALTGPNVAHCRQHLTGYKVPKVVEFRDELPQTTSARSCAASCATRPAPGKG